MQIAAMLLALACSVNALAADVKMKFQASFNQNDEFINVSKGKPISDGEFRMIGVRVKNTGASLGRMNMWAANQPQTVTKVKATTNSSGNIAIAEVVAGNAGFPTLTFSAFVSSGSCDVQSTINNDYLSVDGMIGQLNAEYCEDAGTSCTPNTPITYAYQGTLPDGYVVCYRFVDYQFMDGSGNVESTVEMPTTSYCYPCVAP